MKGLLVLVGLFYLSFGAQYSQYVSQYIGTAFQTSYEDSGNCFPAIGVPHGNTQLSPQTQSSLAKCISPYYYQDTTFQGIRASHWLSGSCTQDYGSLTLTGLSNVLITNITQASCTFDHSQEIMSPSKYTINFNETNQNHCKINTEATGLSYSGLIQYTWNTDSIGDLYVVISSNSDEGSVTIENNQILVHSPVYRLYQGNGTPAGFDGNFVVYFSEKYSSYGVFEGNNQMTNVSSITGSKNGLIGAWVKFSSISFGNQVTVKVGSSFSNTSQANNNLLSEIQSNDFNVQNTFKESEKQWESILSKIEINPGNGYSKTEQNELKIKFYSALYHALLLPRIFGDADGTHVKFGSEPFDSNRLEQLNFNYYDDYSMWDTFRAVHPLLTIIEPSKVIDMWKSVLVKAKNGNWLPIFPCWNSYTDEMIGDHCVSLLTDAVVKKIITNQTEINEAYSFIKKNALEEPKFLERILMVKVEEL